MVLNYSKTGNEILIYIKFHADCQLTNTHKIGSDVYAEALVSASGVIYLHYYYYFNTTRATKACVLFVKYIAMSISVSEHLVWYLLWAFQFMRIILTGLHRTTNTYLRTALNPCVCNQTEYIHTYIQRHCVNIHHNFTASLIENSAKWFIKVLVNIF